MKFKHEYFELIFIYGIYGGLVTGIIFLIYIIYSIIFMDIVWWLYLAFSVFGILIGLGSVGLKYSCADPKDGIILEIYGVPFPAIICEDGIDFPGGLGWILNPIYFMLLMNAVGLLLVTFKEHLFIIGIVFLVSANVISYIQKKINKKK